MPSTYVRLKPEKVKFFAVIGNFAHVNIKSLMIITLILTITFSFYRSFFCSFNNKLSFSLHAFKNSTYCIVDNTINTV